MRREGLVRQSVLTVKIKLFAPERPNVSLQSYHPNFSYLMSGSN